MGGADKRTSVRVDADFIVKFETVDQFAMAYGTEISTGGMFLATTEPLPPGTELDVRLVLPVTHAEVTTRAKVVHARSAADAEKAGVPAGMGVRFLNLDATLRAQLEAFVTERMGAQSARPASGPRREGVSVLVVEDDPTYQRMIAIAFATEDVVRFANNGFEALALCGRETPDVIVSDVNMPKMDGWQLLRLLRTKPQFASVPVLFTTTLNSEADRLRGYRLGVDDYIAKPFRVAELRARIDRLVARVPAPMAREPEPGRPPGRSLHGDLAHVSLASVLGLLEMERRTGRLTVQSNQVGALSLRDGVIVDAIVGKGPAVPGPHGPGFIEHAAFHGRDAVFAMLGWRAGAFEFELRDVGDGDTVGASLSHLLLEHARLTDETGKPRDPR